MKNNNSKSIINQPKSNNYNSIVPLSDETDNPVVTVNPVVNITCSDIFCCIFSKKKPENKESNLGLENA